MASRSPTGLPGSTGLPGQPPVAGTAGNAGVVVPPGPAPPTVGGIGAGAGALGVGAGAAMGGAKDRRGTLSALQEIEEAYNKRLDADIGQLMESFGDIIKVASINYNDTSISKDKYKLAQESYQIQGRAANIVSSAESLLAIVTELKQTLLLNDTTTLAQIAAKRQQELSTRKTAVKQRVVGLKEEVDRTIWELEKACYENSS
ncbi:Mediator of RNA polymerase II transcription subunit 22 [Podila epigama]|nr:Mediator of RNA polymerase II transcription subunit 22 [Podila epigama]